MQSKRACLTSIAWLFLSSCTPAPSNNLHDTYYLATQHVLLSEILAPPPVIGSAQDQQDMAEVLQSQNSRTPEQIKQAQLDAELSVFRFEPALGSQFIPRNLPFTTAFFEKVKQDEDRIVQLAKNHFDRPRPYTTNTLIHPVVAQPANTSYPSGHASFAYMDAILLSKMLPEKSDLIFGRAHEFAQNRIIAGAHYPTDVQAGMIAGSVIAEALLQDKDFIADFNQAKQELRKAILPQ